jgi:hypothetical protein
MALAASARWRSFCGNHLDLDIQALFLEQAGLVGQRQRGKTGPAGHADHHLGLLRGGWRAQPSDATTHGQQRCRFLEKFRAHHILRSIKELIHFQEPRGDAWQSDCVNDIQLV